MKKYLKKFKNIIKGIFYKENIFPLSDKEFKVLNSSILKDITKDYKNTQQIIINVENKEKDKEEKLENEPLIFTKKKFNMLKNFKNKIKRNEIVLEDCLKEKFIKFLERYKKSVILVNFFLDIKNERQEFKFLIKKRIQFKKNNLDFCNFYQIEVIEKKIKKLCLLIIYSVNMKNFNFLVFSTHRILKKSLKDFSKLNTFSDFEEKLKEMNEGFYKNLVQMYFFTNFKDLKEKKKLYKVQVYKFDLKKI